MTMDMLTNEYIWTYWNFCANIRYCIWFCCILRYYGLIKMKNMSKLKHQIKSNKYYVFWGAATIAVIVGQIYIGIGYRIMTQSIIDLTEVFTIIQEQEDVRRYPNL